MAVTGRAWNGTDTMIWTGGVGAGINWSDLVASEGSAFPVPGEWDIADFVKSHVEFRF